MQPVSCILHATDLQEGEIARKNAEDASVVAASQAARADALARALRKAESTRDQLQRLKAENEALKVGVWWV